MPRPFHDSHFPDSLNLNDEPIACLIRNTSMGSISSIHSIAAVGVLRMAPVIIRQASRCSFRNGTRRASVAVAVSHATDAYDTTGRITAVYTQWVTLGLKPHSFPTAPLTCIRDAVARLAFTEQCSAQFNSSSKITPRNLTDFL